MEQAILKFQTNIGSACLGHGKGTCGLNGKSLGFHDDVIKWKHFPRYWPFVRGIHRSPVNSSLKGQWRGALMFSLICARINGWVNNGEAGDLRRYRVHCDVMTMYKYVSKLLKSFNFVVIYAAPKVLDYKTLTGYQLSCYFNEAPTLKKRCLKMSFVWYRPFIQVWTCYLLYNFVQDCSNCIANRLEVPQPCIKPFIWV